MESEISFISEDIRKTFEHLKYGKNENKIIYKNLIIVITKLRINPMSGIQIPKKLIPKAYIKKYFLRNLWKYNMPNGYRLLYSVKSDGIIIVAIIIEWLPHKDYERKFNY
jgi:Txe/YoeB family toxin of Txe-Axe toxin-antitoxin module